MPAAGRWRACAGRWRSCRRRRRTGSARASRRCGRTRPRRGRRRSGRRPRWRAGPRRRPASSCSAMSSRRSASLTKSAFLATKSVSQSSSSSAPSLLTTRPLVVGALEALADVLGALDAQELDGLVEVAVGLGQGLLAVHHAGAGEVAELLDVGGGEVSHVTLLWVCDGARTVVRACRGRRPDRYWSGRRRAIRPAAGGLARRPARRPPRERRPRRRRRRLGRRLRGGRRGLGGRASAASPPVRSSRSHSASGSSPPMAGSAPSSRPALACAAGAGHQALGDGVGDHPGQHGDAADRVVVARDLVVDLVRVAVGVEDRDDRDAQLAGLADGDVLLLGVDDPDGAGHLLHVADTAEGALELGLLAGEDQLLLLGEADQRRRSARCPRAP